MENKIYNDDVERIVNDREANTTNRAWETPAEFHAKRNYKRQQKIAIDVFVYAVFSVSFLVIGCVGCMVEWLAFPVSAICGLFSALNLGKWIENRNCWGWK